MQNAIQTLGEMVRDGVIEDYVIGGAPEESVRDGAVQSEAMAD